MTKTLSFCILLSLAVSPTFSQSTTARFQGTIRPGSSINTIMLSIRPNETFNGTITNLQFVVQVPHNITPKPSVVIKSNPLAGFIASGDYVMETSDEEGYYNYLLAVVPSPASPVYNFKANTQVDALELAFVNGPANIASEVRFAQVTNGGATSQKNFYVEINGNDNTQTSGMFYGAGAKDNAGYSGYSYVPAANVALPILINSFTVKKQGVDAAIQWQAEDGNLAEEYQLQRSTNGRDFTTIYTTQKIPGYGLTTYNYTDKNVAQLNEQTLYYRVKQVETGGKGNFSEIHSIQFDDDNRFKLYPNPTQQGFYVSAQFDDAYGKVQLKLFNTAGQLVTTREITTIQAKQYYFSLTPGVIANGIYTLRIYKNNKLATTKQVVVQP